MLKINEKLKHFRNIKGLSIKEVARRVGVPETTYRQWEYGRKIQGEPYMKIAKAFNINILELIPHEDVDMSEVLEHVRNIDSELYNLRQKLHLIIKR